MKVDLPTPGTPETPSRNASRAGAGSAVSSASARSRWSARVDSSSVIAFAIARRCASPGAASTSSSSAWSSGGSIATRPGVQAWTAASERLICSSTSLALAGIGVPGP